MKNARKSSWSETEAGVAAYKVAKAEAQRLADADGFDRGIELNELFRKWTIHSLPDKKHRFGFELRIECVSCTDLKRCRPGHGPTAR